MSLQVTHRPNTFDDIVGNEDIIESLKSVLERDNPPSTYLFTGESGTGKTTLARILSYELDVHKSDFTEQNASDERGIDAVRKLSQNMKFAPLHGKRKFILMDEIHSMTKVAQESLLKTLEEPPSYVFIALCTTNPEALKQTLKRRCHQYDLRTLNVNELSLLIKRTLKAEKVPLKSFNIKVAEKIVELADGSAGQCMKLLDMVIDMKNVSNALKTLESVGMGAGSAEIIDICRLLVDQNMNDKTRWMRISALLKDLKTDGESARRPILGYLQAVLLSSGRIDIADTMTFFADNYFDTGKTGLVLSCFLACHKG